MGGGKGRRTIRDRDAVSESGRPLGRDVLPALVDVALELPRGAEPAKRNGRPPDRIDGQRLEGDQHTRARARARTKRRRTMTPMIWFEVGPDVSWAAMSLATLIWFSCFLDELPLRERGGRGHESDWGQRSLGGGKGGGGRGSALSEGRGEDRRGCALAGVDHDLLDEAGFAELLADGGDVLGRKVGALVRAAEDDVGRVVALGLDDGRQAVLGDREEGVGRGRRPDRIDRNVDRAVGPVLEADGHREGARELAVDLRLGRPRTDRTPRDELGRELGRDRI